MRYKSETPNMETKTVLSIDEIEELLDLGDLSESTYLEIKKAAGEDGRGQIPDSTYHTYSAFANTQGGIILLGFQEVSSSDYILTGIIDPERVISQLWNALNNREKVSINILTEQMVSINTHNGTRFIKINIPPAKRQQKPVYIGKNPLTGTYRRNFSGDYLCDDATVKRMLAEQIEESRDSKLLSHFTEADLDENTLRSFRHRFRSTKPTHPWNSLDDHEFLRSIGGLTKDRESGEEGLTLAGLLMFGKLRSILDVAPYYLLDYQERRAEEDNGTRWIDRFTTDGTWTGNLYDFTQIVIQRLYRDLKVPFRLDGPSRVDDTPVHEALREALINTLVHADYSSSVPIQIIKRPDVFFFRNPGLMRVPINDAIRGGLSDCRNRNLHTMFNLVGFGERAGSGLPKIFLNWRDQLWRRPELVERFDPEQTNLVLRMVSLLPDNVMKNLERRFGSEFSELSEEQKLALATVEIEGSVTHARIKEISGIHPRDLSKALKDLVIRGFLESSGATRAVVYSYPSDFMVLDETIQARLDTSGQKNGSSVQTTGSSLQSEGSLEHSKLSLEQLERFRVIAQPIAEKGRVPALTVEEAIVQLCTDNYLNAREIGQFLNRTPDALKIHYLRRMVKAGILELHYPDSPTHPDQGYRTRKS